MAQADPDIRRRLGWPLLLTTMSALLLELALTRLFSVVLFYHYAFLVISIALLGLASGGIFARFLPRDLDPQKHGRAMGICCLVACATLIPCLYFILGTKIFLMTTWGSFARVTLLYLLCMLPFGMAGVVIASAMSRGGGSIAKLYFFDLLGASLGCVLFVPLMKILGGPNTVLAVGVLWCVSALFWIGRSNSRVVSYVSIGLLVGMSGLILVNRNGAVLEVRYTRGMELKNEVFTRWNSFSRVSVYQNQAGHYWIELDGGAGTWVCDVPLDGDVGRQFSEMMGRTGPEVAFWLKDHPKVLVVGSGGGYDLARAVGAGSPDVTAAEINPIIANDVMRGQFQEHSRGLYVRPEVRVFVEDGRSFVHRTTERYDVIQLSLVDTWASSASGAYALTENYLYTVEALEKYLSKLTDEGIVSITRWEFPKPRETLRLVSVVLEALERSGVQNPEEHVVVILEDVDGGENTPRMGTVLVRKAPFTGREIEAIVTKSEGTLMEMAYAPGLMGGVAPFPEFIRSKDRVQFAQAYEYDISPADDDRPFFFFMYPWSSLTKELFHFDPSGDAVSASAQLLLLALLGISVVAVAVFLFAPLLLFRRVAPVEKGLFPSLFFCLSVGLGYILIEIALIQKFAVFLGQPTYSLTVVVFGLLLASGFGSHLSQSFPMESLRRRAQLVLGGVVVLALVQMAIQSRILEAAQGAPLLLKINIVLAMILPLGFLMGIPFPSGLRLIAANRPNSVEWSWATNAAATVLGSVLAIFLAVTVGISRVLLTGAVLYAVATVLMAYVARRRVGAPESVPQAKPEGTSPPKTRPKTPEHAAPRPPKARTPVPQPVLAKSTK